MSVVREVNSLSVCCYFSLSPSRTHTHARGENRHVLGKLGIHSTYLLCRVYIWDPGTKYIYWYTIKFDII